MSDLEDELRAAREVIAVLQRRLERELQNRNVDSAAAHRAITSLENTVDLRTRELEASEAHYRAIFDHSPISTFLVDELGIVLRANAAASQAFAGAGELVERPLVELFKDAARDAIEELLDRGEGEIHEVELGNGVIADISVGQVPDVGHMQISLHDVTAPVELGRELQHARRLAAIGHLAAGVAHEINNPLAVLQLGLEELEAGGDRQRVPELIGHAERIARIVSNLQTFAAPRPPERSRVPIVELVASAKELAARMIEGVKLRLVVEPPELAVHVDRGQLEQVLTNLLTNAGRALRGSGTIEIEALAEGERVRLQIRDSGPGIPAALLEQIFAPFVSAGERTGMGLGLAISWGLVQENQGRIRAFNPPTGGACFELELPRAEPVVVAAPSTAVKPDPRAPSLRILCVEDEESLRRSLLRLLQLAGHEPVGVGSAEDGVERLASEAFDLVISDVRLPGRDGEWLRRQVAEHHPALRERVLLMSGFFPDVETPHFLQKPFSLAQLRTAIAAIVG
jgi:PAS domain S-box-containing protein